MPLLSNGGFKAAPGTRYRAVSNPTRVNNGGAAQLMGEATRVGRVGERKSGPV
ncbi:hypothetical protein TCELL_1033 [Thermogladius calderae 1633]|uniref:Uncharacterized protein n=1 Tax=Thermogladius calderae (strain DSM 22663 / VKM B-2946 / 1633) TaxID=1184251 RepID=I3TFB8_THEC1|nr:hypothetical protein TCELL_1033 [Thermogladius calderae 1633]